jgi:putative membrane protein
MLLGGIAFLRLTDFESIRWVGYVSLALSAILICIGLVRSYVIRRRLTRYYKINALIAKSEREKKEE